MLCAGVGHPASVHQVVTASLARPSGCRCSDNERTLCNCGFGGLWVACWPLVPKFAGSNPAEADFSGPALFRKGSKTVGPMSQICGMQKIRELTWKSQLQTKLPVNSRPRISTFRYWMCSAFGT